MPNFFTRILFCYAHYMMKRPGRKALFVVMIPFFFGGCSTYPRQAERYQRVAIDALRDPYTSMPLVGGLLFSIGGLDRRSSDWAQKETPIFGSPSRALKESSGLRDAVDHGASLLILTAPVKKEQNWLYAKGVSFANAGSSLILTRSTTFMLKRRVSRMRPNGVSRDSFPSDHSASSFNYAAVGRRFNHTASYDDTIKSGIDYGLNLTAMGAAWARVEAGVHYPSDVLFGAALGNFFGLFIYDAFLGGESGHTRLSFNPYTGGPQLTLSGRF